MICGGDEIGRGQQGNNNAYAQDNELTWYDWDLDASRKSLLEFTRRLIAFRLDHPNLHRRKFFQDRKIDPAGVERVDVAGAKVRDITWVRQDGSEMTDDEWHAGWIRALGLQLSGETLEDVNGIGEPIRDDTFLILFNSHHEALQFCLPMATHEGIEWTCCINTCSGAPVGDVRFAGGVCFELDGRSVAVFKQSLKDDAKA